MEWLKALVSEHAAHPLSRAPLSREQVAQFLAESRKHFMDPGFKQALKVCRAQRGRRLGGMLHTHAMVDERQVSQPAWDLPLRAVLAPANPYRSALQAAHAKGEDVQEAVDQMQATLFTNMGIQPDFGLAQLSQVRVTFGDDAELMTQFYALVSAEEMLMDEVELPAEEFSAK